jgi:oligosaccharide repeat unit polymerase
MSLAMAFIFFILFYVNINIFSRDIRHPSNLYLAVWTILFLLLSIPLVNYIPVPIIAYIFILLSTMVFICAGNVGGAVVKKAVENQLTYKNNYLSDNILIVFGSVGLIAALLYYQSRFGLLRLITDPGGVRTEDGGGTGLLGLLIFMPTVMFILIVIQSFLKKRISLISVVYLVAVLVYMAILPERTTLINTVVWSSLSAYSVNRSSQRLNKHFVSRRLPTILALLSIFLIFFVFVSARTQKVRWIDGAAYALRFDLGSYKAIYDPYVYITANVPALGAAVNEVAQNNKLITFEPSKTNVFINRFVQIIFNDINTSNLTSNAEFIRVPFKFNTFSWLYEPLEDFGLFGAFIYVGLFGLVSGLSWAYRNAHNTPLSAYLYGWAGTSIVFSIMTNKFSSIYFNYALVIVFMIYAPKQILQSYHRRNRPAQDQNIA